jgi:hypothetical protein
MAGLVEQAQQILNETGSIQEVATHCGVRVQTIRNNITNGVLTMPNIVVEEEPEELEE